ASEVLGVVAAPLLNRVSRQVEREADWAALQATGDPDAAIELQRGLVLRNLGVPNPPPWVQLVLGSHPTALERVGLPLRARAGRPRPARPGHPGRPCPTPPPLPRPPRRSRPPRVTSSGTPRRRSSSPRRPTPSTATWRRRSRWPSRALPGARRGRSRSRSPRC